jgi:hypothetical protein
MEHEQQAKNCWAPEITWDPEAEQYVIYWATTISGAFQETAGSAKHGNNHRIYCTTTKDFKTYTDTALFYEPGFNVIDSTIQHIGPGKYVMILKDETLYPEAKKCLKLAFSDQVSEGWKSASESFTDSIEGWKEGPTLFKNGAWWICYFDVYDQHHYGAMRTRDFQTWEDISDQIEYPKGMRHGTILPVSEGVLQNLIKQSPKTGMVR